ncbi:MAG TPA: extracellular solute-binding protein [Geminicoccaceae bacterium]|nr:extracellular solute-binding protein [Geminicoccus sp.]HMU52219.1 extracellular solute-binding protein [Geminicoccaceae bacterium]
MAAHDNVPKRVENSRRALLAGIAGTALARVFAPNIIGVARAAGNDKIDLGGYAGPKLTSEPVTLRFMRQDFTPAVNALLEGAYAEFTATYPNITITEEKVPYGDLQKKLVVYVASNDAPDIMMGRTDFVDAYHAGKLALPLQDYFTPDYISDIPDNLRDAASAGGNLYCLPWETNINFLYFNRDLFAKAGVQTPPEVNGLEGGWTAEEFIAHLDELNTKLKAVGDNQSWALAAATQGNGGPGANYSQVESIWIRSQGDPNAAKDSSAYKTLMGISDDGLSVTGYIDTPEAIKGMQNYQSLFSKGLVPLGSVPNQFPAGIAATHLGGPNYSSRFILPGQEPPFKWGVSPPPKGKIVFNGNASDAPIVWSKAKHPAEAVALMAFLCNDKNRLAFHKGWGSMPSRKSLRTAMSGFALEQPFKLASALSDASYSVPRTPGYFDYFNAMNPAVKDIALGADPAKMLPDTAAKINRLLAKYR